MRAAALGFVLVLSSIAPLASVGHAQIPGRAQGFQPNFQDADLAYVFTALAQAAGINIIHSGLPARSVTLRSQTPCAGRHRRSHLSLAAANGVSITEGNGFCGCRVVAPTSAAAGHASAFIYRLRQRARRSLRKRCRRSSVAATCRNGKPVRKP
jgi:hypothetical protein